MATVHENSWLPVLLGIVVRPLAITFGTHIFLRRKVNLDIESKEHLLRHEMVHVLQYLDLGFFLFYWFYVTDWLRAMWLTRGKGSEAYRKIRFEQEARAIAAIATNMKTPWRQVEIWRKIGAWKELKLSK